MKAKLAALSEIIKKTAQGWNDDDPFRSSAVIAYYAIFSLPALLVLIINVAGVFFGTDTVSGEISKQVESVMGEETAKQVADIVANAGTIKAGIISSIIAIATIIFGATGVFVQLQKALNEIWDVKQKSTKGFLRMLKNRLFSFGLILSIGFLLLISLVISSVLAATSEWMKNILPDAIVYVFFVLEFGISLVVTGTLFALMFKFLPDVKMRWKDIIPGAFLTGLLFMLGKYALSLYFGKADPASAYGVAGSVVLILLWTSYSSMIVFFGAEFTKQRAVYYGKKMTPTKNAEMTKIDFDAADSENFTAEKSG
ncbi:MAG: YihY/virulence factor BrkB family protein [Bacteroidota bacterium]|nr:YihY/virulence factor BrkB family protein [Bacteroidota bacterium]